MERKSKWRTVGKQAALVAALVILAKLSGLPLVQLAAPLLGVGQALPVQDPAP